MENQKVQHFFNRASFGTSSNFLKNTSIQTPQSLFEKMYADSLNFTPIEVVTNEDVAEYMEMKMEFKNKKNVNKDSNKNAKKDLKKDNREAILDLNITWLNLMAEGNGGLREKMALFWHGHLVARTLNPFFTQSYLNTLRKNALGNFGDLLKAVSKEPAMLQFLNNNKNKKQSPNENFARELLELFTLGRGNYTENDIKEIAKAFTGWDYDKNGKFKVNFKNHDETQKEIFGKKGDFSGDDVLKILLEKEETALFVTKKIVSFFANENCEEKHIKQLANVFYKSNYDIKILLEKMFTSDWFYDEKNRANRIKSPIELLVGIKKTMPFDFVRKEGVIYIQRVLGQVLLYPPNVAGWASGTNWIDSSSLVFRMQLPHILLRSNLSTIEVKEDVDLEIKKKYHGKNSLTTRIYWDKIISNFSDNSSEMFQQVKQLLLCVELPDDKLPNALDKLSFQTKQEKLAFILEKIMSIPEYQLC